MAPLDFLAGPLRSLLGIAEQAETNVAARTPLHETRELERRLGEAVEAVHRSADSLERQIAVLETLANSLPPLTESVTRLTDQLVPLLGVIAPIDSAERELSQAEHLFRRHRHEHAAEGTGKGGEPAPD
jgi:hypothetical protein